ncbi:MAG: hypothetical protein K6C94_05645 [Candidatus Gastranaerophilales bacterium]|nr:hypothetical protein [Candidatus Gastranaerophilales bacterium]
MGKINREELKTEKQKHLYDLLKDVAEKANYFDVDTFVYCNVLDMDTEERQDKMIKAIEVDGLDDLSKINLLNVYITRGLEY